MKSVLLFLIRFYRRFLSALKPVPTCRFYPTCSEYAYIAVSRFGALRGGLLAVKRLLKCHPFHSGGYDPVPDVWPGKFPVVPAIGTGISNERNQS